jgi:hypothetical protein
MKRFWILGILLLLATVAFAGEKNDKKDNDKDKDQYSELKVKVLKATNGKPIRNAIVVLHSVNDKGKQESGGLNLKTDLEGEASYSGIPYGKLRVQVIMSGYQTYGEDHEIDQPQQEIVVKLEPPQKQYSIYDKPGTPPSPVKH